MVAARTSTSRAAGLPATPLLPYQRAWVLDQSPCAVWEKSRRVGADFVEAYRAVSLRLSGKRLNDYWYSSADESAAVEFMVYVKQFLGMFAELCEFIDQREMFEGRDVRVMSVLLPEVKGRRPRITVMTSSPTRMRSKGGDVTLSEFAFHSDADTMWQAAVPVTTWGGQLRIISTHNGEDSRYNQLLQQARKPADQRRATDLVASVHRVTIHDAVEQGLVERINAVTGTNYTREEFVTQLRSRAGSEDAWLEEYCCVPSQQAMSFLPSSLVLPCVKPNLPMPTDNLARFIADVRAHSEGCDSISAGCDVGRVKDRFVIWVVARFGSVRRTVGAFVAQGIDFTAMESAITVAMTAPGFKIRRMAIDASGLGMQLAERMGRQFRGRVEEVTMTASTKEDALTRLRASLEEKTIHLPDDPDTHADFVSVRREITAAGNTRYAADSSEHGHADRAIACSLALVADETARPRGRMVDVMGVV